MSCNSGASTKPVVRGKCQSHNPARCPGCSVADCLLCFWSFLSNSQFHKNSQSLNTSVSNSDCQVCKCLRLSWWDNDVVMTDCQWRISFLQVAALWTALWKFLKVWIIKILVHRAQFKSTSCYIPSSSNTWQYSAVLFITQVCTKIRGIGLVVT